MKVLILTMTCGEGHNSVSKSIKNILEKNNCEVEIYNIYESNRLLYKFNSIGYVFACKNLPKIYNKIWNKQLNRDPEKRYVGGIQSSVKPVTNAVLKKIEDYKPDIIICSHYYASTIVCNLKRQNKVDSKIKIIAILTDFLPHPFWEGSILVDKIFIPNDCARERLLQKGFKNEQIITTGLPINDCYNEMLDKKIARNQIGLDDKFTVLLLGGGFGIGRNDILLKKILKKINDIQIICLCGRNNKLYKKINRIINKNNLKNVKNYSFTPNLNTIYSAADVAVSKAGFLTISECVKKNLPIIFREKAIINEKENIKQLVKFGCAVEAFSKDDVVSKIASLKNSDDLLDMSSRCEYIFDNDSAEKIYINIIK